MLGASKQIAGGVGGDDGLSVVPLVAVRWMVYNTFTNVELAILSNVSRRWREIVAQCVIDGVSQEQDNEESLAPPRTFTRLLLPSIIRYYNSSQKNPGDEPGMLGRDEQDEADTYCVAWFHPDGIAFEQLSLVEPSPGVLMDSPDADPGVVSTNLQSTSTCAGNGTTRKMGDHKFLFTRHNSRLDQNSAASSLPASCPASDNIMDWGASVLYQWNGYSEAIDVLGPFGYSRYLLRRILEKTKDKMIGNCSNPTIAIDHTTKQDEIVDHESIVLPSSAPWVFRTRCDNTTYSSHAVRGATIARPEGYCECWDKDDAEFLGSKDELWVKKRNQRKRELQREVLPKVLWSKHDGDDNVAEAGGIFRPCIQFLNIDSNHAIRLFTPKFEKPISTPLTVFCVAIATEDGCFFSGLHQKFEMGHMHPTEYNNQIHDERSPICINADYKEDDTHQEAEISTGDESRADATFLDSNCSCFSPFVANQEDSSSTEDEDEYCENVIRGQLGPGVWHCYVAVFDGERSVIRIDGEEEVTNHASRIHPSFRAYLDGITIGSDHLFDMSLCFGQGSDGEGEGAISELVFFKGHLQPKDICSLESHLMAKHGISAPAKPRKERVNDDYYSRLAHSLMDQAPTSAHQKPSAKEIPIPLRYMTKLRHVAWEQKHKVTGRQVSVQRIGDKWRKGSMSQW